MIKDIIEGKCPRCREAKIFNYPPYNYLKFSQMKSDCPNCGQTFIPEPGFYFGAMYISYAFSVAWVMGICLLLIVLDKFTLVNAAVLVSVGIILLFPFLFQYSRIIFLYAFGGIRRQQ